MTKKAYLFLLITLILGIILGVAVENLLEMRRFNKMTERMHEPVSFRDGISQRLQLSEEQLDSLQPILDFYAEKSQMHREEARITYQAEIDSMFVKMMPYLNEEQVKIVEEIMKDDGPDKPFMPWFGKPPKSGKFFGPPPGDDRPPRDQKPGDRERGDNPPPRPPF